MVGIIRKLSCLLLLSCLALGQAAAAGKVKVAVLDVKAVGAIDAKTIAGLSTLIAYEASQFPVQVISGSDVRALISHDREKQILGCSDSSCLAEIGGALGVEYILSTEVSEVGGVWLVSLTLLDVSKSLAAKRVIKKARRESHLVAAATEATQEIFPGVGLRSQPENAPVAVETEARPKARNSAATVVPKEALESQDESTPPRLRRRNKGLMITGIALVGVGVLATLGAVAPGNAPGETKGLFVVGTLCGAAGTPLWIIGRKLVPAENRAGLLSPPADAMVLSATPTGLQLTF
jgi:hypothetical protein